MQEEPENHHLHRVIAAVQLEDIRTHHSHIDYYKKARRQAMDLNALLGRGMVDPAVLGERLFEEFQDRLTSSEIFANISAEPPEELLATAFGNWLAGIIDNESSTASTPTAGRSRADRICKELADRNVVLAAALGACNCCWGSNFDCPVCAGAGAPGWIQPEEQLYIAYVDPAIRAFTRAGD
jgi:hypothetical protein